MIFFLFAVRLDARSTNRRVIAFARKSNLAYEIQFSDGNVSDLRESHSRGHSTTTNGISFSNLTKMLDYGRGTRIQSIFECGKSNNGN